MKKKDVDMIETLLDKNEFFLQKRKITEDEYLLNNFHLIDVMERFLKANERKTILSFLEDEFSLPKFKLSILILKATPN